MTSVREDLKKMSIDALRARDKVTRQRLTGVLAKFTELEKTKALDGWNDQLERDTVARYVKSLKSSLDGLREGSVKEGYKAEIALLAPFLPQLMDEAATRALVEPLVGEVKGLGQLMGRVMKQHKGQVDAGLVRRIAMELGLK